MAVELVVLFGGTAWFMEEKAVAKRIKQVNALKIKSPKALEQLD
jgi:hypothetical protein